ncbi:MAG: Na+/H+ antiporter NhaA [Gemmatimonadaceae bacterium]
MNHTEKRDAVVRPGTIRRVLGPFEEFVRAEASGGIVLLVAAIVAIGWANSPFSDTYHHLWEWKLSLGWQPYYLTLSLHEWINDALMAVFFFLVGLEIKREILAGELASVRRAALPIMGALGGMIVPALLFVLVTRGTPAVAGWGIPMATDIAFALGVATLLGPRVPPGLKVFLAALAIVDDIGAVLVIAIFYTAQINVAALALAGVLVAVLILLNFLNVQRALPYIAIGIALWLAVLNSGLHATIAGVLLAFTIPATTRNSKPTSITKESDSSASKDALLQKFEHALHGVVAFGIMPMFALANAGVSVGQEFAMLVRQPAMFAVVTGLLIGKPLGITGFAWASVRLNVAQLPSNSNWRQLIGVAALGGIGFTMSLFIAALAYGENIELAEAKIGVLLGSLAAGILGWIVLRSGAFTVSEESTTTL